MREEGGLPPQLAGQKYRQVVPLVAAMSPRVERVRSHQALERRCPRPQRLFMQVAIPGTALSRQGLRRWRLCLHKLSNRTNMVRQSIQNRWDKDPQLRPTSRRQSTPIPSRGPRGRFKPPFPPGPPPRKSDPHPALATTHHHRIWVLVSWPSSRRTILVTKSKRWQLST